MSRVDRFLKAPDAVWDDKWIDFARALERENEELRLLCADRDHQYQTALEYRAMFEWLEAHAISVRIQANERQSFVIPATREAIRFEMTSGNVTSPNNA